MRELWDKARERVESKCKVCRTCNCVACAGDLPGMGGIGTGTSAINNHKALAEKRLNMRVLHEANDPDCSLEVWGKKLSLPVMAAPVGAISPNLGSDMPDTVYLESMVSCCIEAGTLGSIGDVPDVNITKRNLKIIGDRAGRVVPFLKPWPVEEIMKRLEIVAEAGCDVCGVDVDSANLPILRGSSPAVRVLTGREVAEVAKKAHALGLKFIAKGIMSAQEAVMAADAGCDALVVSNHGGRVLDHTPGTLEVLPEIAAAVGDRLLVMFDGGLRSGADVLKALSLGARLTLVCRPLAIIAHGDEERGIARYFAKLREELTQAMRMTGCKDLAAVGPHVVR